MTASARTALTGVRVFDCERLSPPRNVVIDGDVIGANGDTAGASCVDTGAAVLIPGLIDAHVHVDSRGTREAPCGSHQHGAADRVQQGRPPVGGVGHAITTFVARLPAFTLAWLMASPMACMFACCWASVTAYPTASPPAMPCVWLDAVYTAWRLATTLPG